MRFIAILLAAIVFTMPAAAEKVIGVEIYRSDATFVTLMREAMEEAATGRARLDVAYGGNDQAVQNEWIERHLESGVDALAVNSVDLAASPLILKKARNRGVPIVFFNREPDAAFMPEDGWYYVGAHARQSGQMQGEIMADYFRCNPGADLNGDGVVQCLMLTGQTGHQDAPTRSESCLEAFMDAGFTVAMVDSASANWQRAEARDIMEAWLTAYDNIEAVFANNDEMALGAIDAMKAAGYFTAGKSIPVVGVDGTQAAVAAMREGTLLGTVYNDAVNQGRAVINLALVLANGETPTPKNIGYPITDGRYVWIPYAKMTPESIQTPYP
jgi:methyl-galactoside transport system substrate-binding protein